MEIKSGSHCFHFKFFSSLSLSLSLSPSPSPSPSLPLFLSLSLFLVLKLISSLSSAELRSKKELGYVVLSFTRNEYNVLAWAILVQTDRRMSLAESLVDDFIASIASLLENLSAEHFSDSIASLVSAYKEPPHNISEKTAEHWNAIDNFSYDFQRKEKIIAYLESGVLSAAMLKDFHNTYIAPKAPKRRVLLARVFAGDESVPKSELAVKELQEEELPQRDHDVVCVAVGNVGEWRRGRPLYPAKNGTIASL